MNYMQGRMGQIAVAGIWALAAGLILLLCTIGWLFSQQQHEVARADNEPPHVLVTSPASGATVPAGTFQIVAATVFGTKPIARAELWVDGVLKGTESGLSAQDISPLYAHFELLVPSGKHQLLVRGIDTGGNFGQSVPMNIVGGPPPSKVSLVVPVKAGDTVAKIASTYSTTVSAIQTANPGLGNLEPAPDTSVIVPAPPMEWPASDGPSDSVGSTGEGGPVPFPNTSPLLPADPNLDIVGLFLQALVAKPPTAPSNLWAEVSNCKIKLRWNDNADNEARYDVWMSSPASNPRIIASLKPASGGTVWYEFSPMQTGKLSLWVEAANSIGGRPSNIVPVTIDSKCSSSTHMSIQALEINVGGGYDKTYCYVSFQGAPEIRIPVEPMQFIGVTGGKGDVGSGGQGKFAIPIPTGGALDISGECWGWSGKTLSNLGTFSRKIVADEWDGRKIEIKGTSFSIWITISSSRQPFGDPGPGAGQACGGSIPDNPNAPSPLDAIDPSLAVPTNLSVLGKTSPGVPGSNKLSLLWDWSGDSQKACGYVVFVDGKPYAFLTGVDKKGFELTFPLAMCGRTVKIQVAANTGASRSNLSDPYSFQLPKCQAYLMVKFDKIVVYPPGENQSDMCHWGSMYYTLTVNDTAVHFGGPEPGFAEGAFFTSLRGCGQYTFQSLGQAFGKPHPDTIVVPIPQQNIKVHISFSARNKPGFAQPGTFEGHQIYYSWSSASLAASYLGCGLYASSQRGDYKDYTGAPTYPGAPPGSGTGSFGLSKSYGGGKSDLYYQMMVFPAGEKCGTQNPPYFP